MPVNEYRNGGTKTTRDSGKEHMQSKYCADTHMGEVDGWAATSIRNLCLSFEQKTADWTSTLLERWPLFHATHEVVWRLSSDIVFAKLALPRQSLIQLLVLFGKTSGSRTIAVLHTTYRLVMRLVSSRRWVGHQVCWTVEICAQTQLRPRSAHRASYGYRSCTWRRTLRCAFVGT